MTLHLIKLSVGAESVEDLAEWYAERLRDMKKAGQAPKLKHTTRMVPKRVDALLDGGSIYWVIKGQVRARQRLTAIEPFTDGEGISRCHLILDPVLVRVSERPKRPFQGWRYLEPKDAPADLSKGAQGLPADLRRTLSELGLL